MNAFFGVLAQRLQDHAGARFAKIRCLFVMADSEFRMKRTKINFGNLRLLRQEFLAHPAGQCVKLRFGKVAASDAGLVGNNDNQIIESPGSSAQLENPVHELKVFGLMNITVIDVDHAVTVQE